MTPRPTSSSLRAEPHTINISMRLAQARSIALVFTYTEGSCKTCELGEVERKLHRRWLLCFLNTQQFTHLLGLLSVLHGDFDEKEDINLWLIYIIFNLMVYMVYHSLALFVLGCFCKVAHCEQGNHKSASSLC